MSSPLPPLPGIIVEAGFATAAPVQPAGTLILDDPVNGKLNTGTLAGTVTWTDISAYVLGFTITRPATRQQGPLWSYQAGTASILLDNSAGIFDPDNGSSPYAGQLNAMVPVRVRANWGGITYYLFTGYADGWLPAPVTYSAGYAELTLPATDGQKVLNGITLPARTALGLGETTGARISRILGSAGWYTGTEGSVISPGSSTVQATTLGDTAWNLMQVTADSEIGQLYVDGQGRVTFRGRRDMLTDPASNTVQAVFGDLPGTAHPAGTELACAALSRASDDTTLGNDIQATISGGTGTLQEAQDAASIAMYLFPRTYARSDLILQDNPAALSWAQWVLYISKSGEDRFENLAVDPLADPANLWPQVLVRDVGDRIQGWARPAGVPSPVSRDCFIAGISHTFDAAASSWLTTWTLQDAAKYGSFLTLDNPVLGKLNSNALCF